MSYILDALKKADAQRERDPARGIHAQATILPGSSQGGDGRNWLWVAGAAVLVALGWLLWSMYEDKPPVAPPALVRSEPVPAPVAVAPLAAPAVSAPVAAATATSSPQVATAVLPPPAAPRIEPAEPKNIAQPAPHARPQLKTEPRAPTVAAPQPAPAPARASAASGSVPAAATAAAPTAPAPAAAPVPAVVEAGPITRGLPPDAPKLAISGGVYSKNPAQRMLIVNGQVFSQGADVGSGVVLEEIRPKSAVLRFNGARYSVAF